MTSAKKMAAHKNDVKKRIAVATSDLCKAQIALIKAVAAQADIEAYEQGAQNK